MLVSSRLHRTPKSGSTLVSEMEDEGGAGWPGKSEEQMSANALENVIESLVQW